MRRATHRIALDGQPLHGVADEPDFVFLGGDPLAVDELAAHICAHPRLWCGPDRSLVSALAELTERWRCDHGDALAEAGVDGAALDEAARAWLLLFLRAGVPAGRRIVDRSARVIDHACWLGGLFSRAHFVHLSGGVQVDEVRRQPAGLPWLDLDADEVRRDPRAAMVALLDFLGEPDPARRLVALG
jgi:hypothetical protein